MELGRECLKLWGYERVDEIIWVKTNQLQRIIRTGRTGHWLNHGKEHCLVSTITVLERCWFGYQQMQRTHRVLPVVNQACSALQHADRKPWMLCVILPISGDYSWRNNVMMSANTLSGRHSADTAALWLTHISAIRSYLFIVQLFVTCSVQQTAARQVLQSMCDCTAAWMMRENGRQHNGGT